MPERSLILEKYGRTSVTDRSGMDRRRLDVYARRLSELYGRYGLIVVSSGSIATGNAIWADMRPGSMYPNEQSLATLGSGEAFAAWQRALRRQHIPAGQVLISHREIADKSEGAMFEQVLQANLDANIISVCNENDAVSDIEVKAYAYGGDNDGLAAHIASRMGARYFLLRTDVLGLLDGQKNLVKKVDGTNIDEAYAWAGATPGEITNSMSSKVTAARMAASAGIEAYIAHAEAPFEAVIAGDAGTRFVPE
jgi:glutamate 5-kinase